MALPLPIGYDSPAMELSDLIHRTSYPLDRRSFIVLITGGLLAAPLAAEAQKAGKVNLKTAKDLGLTIPPSLLLRADQVVE